MTVNELIRAADAQHPNRCSSEQKAAWISELAGRIRTEVWLRPLCETPRYDPEGTAPLLPLPPAYEGLWLSWLKAQLEYADGAYPAYAKSRGEFNRLCTAYHRWFRTTYDPAAHGYDLPETLGTVSYTCSGCGALALATLPAGALLTGVTCAVTASFGPGALLQLELPDGSLLPAGGLDVSGPGVTVWPCSLLGAAEGSLLRFWLEGASEDGRAAFFGRILYPGKETV